MLRKTRTLWLLAACSLTLLLCMIFTTSSIIFATETGGDLQRYPGCIDFDQPIWLYRETTTPYFGEYASMGQRDRATYAYSCFISIT